MGLRDGSPFHTYERTAIFSCFDERFFNPGNIHKYLAKHSILPRPRIQLRPLGHTSRRPLRQIFLCGLPRKLGGITAQSETGIVLCEVKNTEDCISMQEVHTLITLCLWFGRDNVPYDQECRPRDNLLLEKGAAEPRIFLADWAVTGFVFSPVYK
jgi:hypothetical protein